jgi:hypothetical protein
VIGIDIGKNSFHVVGLDQRGTIVLRQKWSRGQVEAACQHSALPDRHGGLRRGTSSESQAQESRSRCPADAGEVRSQLRWIRAIFEGTIFGVIAYCFGGEELR